MNRVYAVVVARAGDHAKSRLSGTLGPAERSHLVLDMLRDVLAVCAASPDVHGVIAVADAAAATAIKSGVLVQDPGTDMNAAALAGIQAACQRGARTVIVLPADIPRVTTDDLRRLLEAAGDYSRAVVLGASHDGEGTNALLLRPPNAIVPSFGPPSLDRHARLAEAAGCHTVILSHLGLALDIDTPADLALLRSALRH